MKSLTTISTIIVRSGQSPIAGLQRPSSAYKGYLVVLSEAAKARLRDCNSCDCCEGDVYAVSEAAKARLRDCNRDAVRHGHSNHCVRSGQSTIGGLQRAWVAPAPDTLTSSEAAKARLRDCNPPGPRDRERINVRSGQSPIAGLQHMEGEAQPRSSTKSEAAKARLRDCNHMELIASGKAERRSEAAKARLRDCNERDSTIRRLRRSVRSGQSPIAGLQRCGLEEKGGASNVRSGQNPIAGLQRARRPEGCMQ